MPFACIFVPDFPVAALLRAEPELRLQAVAVLDGKAPWQRVFACNEKARALGVEIGMTKLQLETCNHLALRSRTLGQENTAHAALLDCAQSFSPRVEDADWDTILLDLDGLQSLFGASAKLARDMARCAFDFGLETHIAVASNPETAVLAARGFSGVTVIPPGKEAEQLGNLPLLFAIDRHLWLQLRGESGNFPNLRSLGHPPSPRIVCIAGRRRQPTDGPARDSFAAARPWRHFSHLSPRRTTHDF
jgi:hypothetical protein